MTRRLISWLTILGGVNTTWCVLVGTMQTHITGHSVQLLLMIDSWIEQTYELGLGHLDGDMESHHDQHRGVA